MTGYKCAAEGCYAKVEERGAACGGHDDGLEGGIRVVMPEHVVTKTTDDRGRLSLGTEYGGRRVTVAVVDSERDE